MTDLAALKDALDAAAKGLTNVAPRTMFGCHALFHGGGVFGLVWKKGRIGVRLPDRNAFDQLMAHQGAAPWKAGTMTIAHWVLVPESMHEESKTLARWVARAHALNAGIEPKAKRSATSATKPGANKSAKKPAAKSSKKGPSTKPPAKKSATPKAKTAKKKSPR
jgi:TfoX/Sxy family transcriptional regulator of competence genes